MEPAQVRTNQLLNLQRGFERSRLEEQLVATAYERAVPIHRQPLSTPQCSQADDTREQQPPASQGGLSA
jgi:hypothetical protein